MGPIRKVQGPIRKSRNTMGPIRKVHATRRKPRNTEVCPSLSEITPRNANITVQRVSSSEAAGSSSVPEYQPQNDEPPQLQNSILEQVGCSPDALPSQNFLTKDETTLNASNNQTGQVENQAEGNKEAVAEPAMTLQERIQESGQVVANVKLIATHLLHAHSSLDSLGYTEVNPKLMYMLYYQVKCLDTIVEMQLQAPFHPGQMPAAPEVTDVPPIVTGNENEEAVDEQVTTSQDPLGDAFLVFDDMKDMCSNLRIAYLCLESLGFSDVNLLGMKLFFHQLNSVAMIVETVCQITELAKQIQIPVLDANDVEPIV